MKMFIGNSDKNQTRFLVYCESKAHIGKELVDSYIRSFKYRGIQPPHDMIRKHVEKIMITYKWYEVVTPFGMIVDNRIADEMLSKCTSELLQEAIDYELLKN